jgi:shikimate dehydrogenase
MSEPPVRLGLIGWPVAHSLSPAMHTAALRRLGLEGIYRALAVPPEHLGETIGELVNSGYRGVNITIPHKTTVLKYIAHPSAAVNAMQAANTLIFRDGTVYAENTDPDGFIQSLAAAVDLETLRSRPAVIAGAGGAGRGVLYALRRAGFSDITLLARRPEKAASEFPPALAAGQPPRILPFASLVECCAGAGLLVNTTPLGTWPEVEGSIWPDEIPVPPALVIFDLVYNPLETHLLRQAQQGGAKGVNGLEMLVRQGARSLALWLGVNAPLEIMRVACLDELLRRKAC